MADLFLALVEIARGVIREKAPKLYEPATIKAVNGDGTLTLTDGRVAVPETDQPVAPLDHVHVSQTADGRIIVHGPRAS